MCGILAIAGRWEEHPDVLRSEVRRMGLWQHHRGPDDWGEWIGDGVALGHNRLSILDLERGGQPQSSRDGQVRVVFNGEIYNYRSLWSDLEKKGYAFQTDHSDTEVIVHGYREWGVEVFERLEGMFAIAVWDERRRRLVLGRDRAGIKPLFFARQRGGALVVASEPKAIVKAGLVEARMNPAALPEYFLYRAPQDPSSLFAGVSKLPAGTWAAFDRDGLSEPRRYWAPRCHASSFGDEGEAAEALGAELERAVTSHCVSDVPVGLFLSGGTDSSLLAALVSRQLEIEAYTVGTDSRLDEVPYARQAAEHLGTPLNPLMVTPRHFQDRFDDWAYYNDDPVSDPSALALMVLAEYARDSGAKVMLAGEGADELFGGYHAYYRYLVLRRLASLPLLPWVGRWAAKRWWGRSADYVAELPDLHFFGTGHLTTRARRRELLDPELLRDFEGRASRHPVPPDGPCEPLREAMLFDQQVRLPNDLLARTDRATMAVSLETRVPYLDHHVIELANGLPDAWCMRLRGGPEAGKRLLKRLLADRMPRKLVYRSKVGFDLPIAAWLSGPLGPAVREQLRRRQVPGIDYDFLRRSYDAHLSGNQTFTGLIWAWLVLERWYDQWIRGEARPKRPGYVSNERAYRLLEQSWAGSRPRA